MEGLFQLVIFGGLMSLGVLGFYRERAHIADLDEREAAMRLPTSSPDAPIPAVTVPNATTVTGTHQSATAYTMGWAAALPS